MNDQKEHATLLSQELETCGAEGVDPIMVLDALACAGLKIEKMGETNEASEAYVKEISQ